MRNLTAILASISKYGAAHMKLHNLIQINSDNTTDTRCVCRAPQLMFANNHKGKHELVQVKVLSILINH
jgi:hypothetical protein